MTKANRLSVVLGSAQALAWATTYYIPGLMSEAAASTLGTSRTMLLGGFSLALLIAGLSAPAIGRRIERLGGRGVLALGTCLTVLGECALAAAPNVAEWYAAWAVLGIGMAMTLYDAAFATIGRLLGAQARPAIVGVTLLGGFASAIAWPAGTWLVAHVGWRMAALVCAGVQGGVILPLVMFGVPPAPALVPAPADEVPAAPVEGPAFLLLAAFFTLRAAISSLMSVHVLALLQGVGLSVTAAAATAALIGPAQVASRLLDWRLGRGMSALATALIGAALLPTGVASLLLGMPAVVFTVAYGMSNGILTISRGTLPLHIFGPRGYATLLGRLAMPGLLAQAAAPTLAAPLIDHLPAAWILAGVGTISLFAVGVLATVRRQGPD